MVTTKVEKSTEAKEYVLKMTKEHDVKFIRLWFTDVLGMLKSFAITVGELEGALEDGMGFDGSSIRGFARIEESDMVALPDPDTFQLLPWRPKEKAVARMFCDILMPGGEPFKGDPRYVLKRNLQRAAEMGYTFYVGPELEYFYFRDSKGTQTLDEGGYFDLTPMDMASDLRRETVLALEEMGICVEYSHHEVAASQHEIDMRYTDALTMADNVMTYRLVVKQIALKHGVYATFMPKPIFGINGSGMHVHQSLFEGDRNTFFDKNDEYHLSETAKRYIAGLLKHAPEITSITNQWVNSYKRMIPGYEAPVYLSWARRNRSDLIRVPEYRPGRENSTRIELRSPDPACNPYFAFSVMLAAGLEGIEKGYQVPDPIEENVYEMTEEERKKRGIDTLPDSLWEAIQLTEKSELMRRTLGDHVFDSFIKNKRIEWDEYRTQITEYELKRYLPVL
ncbi:glutamine synthetase family protein [Thermodesulfovibrionales bacterium]|nr:glutamine synthetase family protein [Thermodesulfovibrionales bacterium]MCL0042583.1 glutamine synthetase family protein [Thermodesulfovibrionales bacterium]MCL0050120.1 glutamine synthetase family protein [Thermodesulfovibrionales bacterium]MCL0061894.1 glutamine synthetase family protein [Thermodesulfovibrionales bacterium]MCL0068920.1 glutamine synthetase family protein [Thermodesulfovibrionales bacterium]